jgi:anti-sigma B factor antagonist
VVQEFEIEVRSGTATPVVAVRGEVDVATAPQLREGLQRVIADGASTVILDLLGVTFLDSTALGVLVGAHKRCRELGGELRVVVADPRLVKIFEITGLTGVLTISDSLQAAGAL